MYTYPVHGTECQDVNHSHNTAHERTSWHVLSPSLKHPILPVLEVSPAVLWLNRPCTTVVVVCTPPRYSDRKGSAAVCTWLATGCFGSANK